jgi:hypothetical protein
MAQPQVVQAQVLQPQVIQAQALPAVVTAQNPVDQIRKLKQLLDSGAITVEDFEKQKARQLELM